MTTASYTIANKGNLAIQSEKFIIPIDAAKRLVAEMCDLGMIRDGSYWQNAVAKPVRRAVRAKAASVVVYVAGFSTGELSNLLALVDCQVEFAGCV